MATRPIRADLLCESAKERFFARDLLGSQQVYRRAHDADPTCFEAAYGFGLSSLAIGNVGMALVGFEAALVLAPDHPNVHYHLGLISELLADRAGALGHYRVALKATPRHAPAARRAARLQAPNRPR